MLPRLLGILLLMLLGVTSLNATIYLGGKLIMMPDAGLADIASTGQAEESQVDALEETINMLRSVFNNMPGSSHVSPMEIQPLTMPDAEGEDAWMFSPRSRVDFVGNAPFGELRMALLFR